MDPIIPIRGLYDEPQCRKGERGKVCSMRTPRRQERESHFENPLDVLRWPGLDWETDEGKKKKSKRLPGRRNAAPRPDGGRVTERPGKIFNRITPIATKQKEQLVKRDHRKKTSFAATGPQTHPRDTILSLGELVNNVIRPSSNLPFPRAWGTTQVKYRRSIPRISTAPQEKVHSFAAYGPMDDL